LKKFWKKKTKDLAQKYELEEVNKEESGDEKVEKKKNKTKKDDLLKKKKERAEETDEESVEAKPVDKKKTHTESFKAPINVKNQNNETASKTPFKRIDDSLKDNLHHDLQDNSYEKYMALSGDDYGKHANDKLKVTKGRDFKKEKTKFKNKTAYGGLNICTQVRSIKLDDDSD
jgi:hypothetical protein